MAHAYPSAANVRQEKDFMIPPPTNAESAAKAKAFVGAYHDYIKSLGM